MALIKNVWVIIDSNKKEIQLTYNPPKDFIYIDCFYISESNVNILSNKIEISGNLRKIGTNKKEDLKLIDDMFIEEYENKIFKFFNIKQSYKKIPIIPYLYKEYEKCILTLIGYSLIFLDMWISTYENY